MKDEIINELYDIAVEAAKKAGSIISEYAGEKVTVDTKDDKGGSTIASQVVTKVDALAQEAILSCIEPTLKKHQLGLLTEESDDNGSRFEQDYFWCIDPLDGTLSFINNAPGYSVSLALVSKEGVPVLGLVYDPQTDTLYSAKKGKGTFKNEAPWTINKQNDTLIFVTDKGFKESEFFANTFQKLEKLSLEMGYANLEVFVHGGAVLNAISALEHAPGCFFKPPKPSRGGGCPWDYAATVCIYNEMKAPSGNFFGESIQLNPLDDLFMNKKGVLFASNLDIFKKILSTFSG